MIPAVNWIREIDFKYLLIDAAILLLAFGYIDLYAVTHETLPLFIYYLFPVQCLLILVMWGDMTISDYDEMGEIGVVAKIKKKVMQVCQAFLLLSWIVSFIWMMPVLEYLQESTGEYFYWTARITVALGILTGILMMIRLFSLDSEKKYIENWHKSGKEYATWPEYVIVPIYGFLIYGNVKREWMRTVFALTIGVVFLLYTESVFELVFNWGGVSTAYLIFALVLSYLPVRLLLALRPPFSLTELFCAVAALGVFIWSLWDY